MSSPITLCCILLMCGGLSQTAGIPNPHEDETNAPDDPKVVSAPLKNDRVTSHSKQTLEILKDDTSDNKNFVKVHDEGLDHDSRTVNLANTTKRDKIKNNTDTKTDKSKRSDNQAQLNLNAESKSSSSSGYVVDPSFDEELDIYKSIVEAGARKSNQQINSSSFYDAVKTSTKVSGDEEVQSNSKSKTASQEGNFFKALGDIQFPQDLIDEKLVPHKVFTTYNYSSLSSGSEEPKNITVVVIKQGNQNGGGTQLSSGQSSAADAQNNVKQTSSTFQPSSSTTQGAASVLPQLVLNNEQKEVLQSSNRQSSHADLSTLGGDKQNGVSYTVTKYEFANTKSQNQGGGINTAGEANQHAQSESTVKESSMNQLHHASLSNQKLTENTEQSFVNNHSAASTSENANKNQADLQTRFGNQNLFEIQESHGKIHESETSGQSSAFTGDAYQHYMKGNDYMVRFKPVASVIKDNEMHPSEVNDSSNYLFQFNGPNYILLPEKPNLPQGYEGDNFMKVYSTSTNGQQSQLHYAHLPPVTTPEYNHLIHGDHKYVKTDSSVAQNLYHTSQLSEHERQHQENSPGVNLHGQEHFPAEHYYNLQESQTNANEKKFLEQPSRYGNFYDIHSFENSPKYLHRVAYSLRPLDPAYATTDNTLKQVSNYGSQNQKYLLIPADTNLDTSNDGHPYPLRRPAEALLGTSEHTEKEAYETSKLDSVSENHKYVSLPEYNAFLKNSALENDRSKFKNGALRIPLDPGFTESAAGGKYETLKLKGVEGLNTQHYVLVPADSFPEHVVPKYVRVPYPLREPLDSISVNSERDKKHQLEGISQTSNYGKHQHYIPIPDDTPHESSGMSQASSQHEHEHLYYPTRKHPHETAQLEVNSKTSEYANKYGIVPQDSVSQSKIYNWLPLSSRQRPFYREHSGHLRPLEDISDTYSAESSTRYNGPSYGGRRKYYVALGPEESVLSHPFAVRTKGNRPVYRKYITDKHYILVPVDQISSSRQRPPVYGY